ncbi:MAG: hypothetical protein V7742_21200 [Halioglobus sp.]
MLPRYQKHSDHDTRIGSAVTAIKAILPLNLYPAHKRFLLSSSIWHITEADGKFKVRYWSEGAIDSDKKDWRHEHIHERRELIERLLNGEAVDSVVADAIACIVSRKEHELLGAQTGSGWSRYRTAGIRVYDSLEGCWRQ